MTLATWAATLCTLVLLVRGAPAEPCCAGDINNDHVVTIDEILRAVNAALNGCSSAPVPCQGGKLPATGQTTQYVEGDDGSIRAGAALQYVDNGDGTISDVTTGLMWEKKIKLDGTADAADLHDADNCYPWAGTCSVGGASCGTDGDCGADGPCEATDCQRGDLTIFKWVAALNTANFAGHNDWRIPNKKELQSILDEGTSSPAVAVAFNGTSCGAACTDMMDAACSCTQSGLYWSSTTVAGNPGFAWYVYFYRGGVSPDGKVDNGYVRAVRGGL
jgi:hypothetical protein